MRVCDDMHRYMRTHTFSTHTHTRVHKNVCTCVIQTHTHIHMYMHEDILHDARHPSTSVLPPTGLGCQGSVETRRRVELIVSEYLSERSFLHSLCVELYIANVELFSLQPPQAVTLQTRKTLNCLG